jgi:tRNA(fMet)-specific endonuclease VapC
MSGKRYLLDTNAISALLQGNSQLVSLLQEADWVGISVISQLELLAFSGLSQSDRQVFEQFLQRTNVIDLATGNVALIEKIIQIRQDFRLKLPDAIIAATALQSAASLITADREFAKIPTLAVVGW